MIELYEFSIRALVNDNDVRAFLADAMGIDHSQIMSVATFWDSAESRQGKFVGMEVYNSNSGFKTLCKWRQTWNLQDIEFFQLASYASGKFNSEVAIGNFLELQNVSTDQFIVITPAQQFYRAYAVTNTEVFDTAPVDNELYDVERFMKQERTAKRKQP
ncbi:MAG: hypothetical protein U0894_12210 [Pirellulales bacterium]